MKQIIEKLKSLIGIVLFLSIIHTAFPTVSAQTKRGNAKAKSSKTADEKKSTAAETLVSASSNPALSAVWQSGELPAPLPVPAGNADEAAAILAQKVAAKSEESVPALLTALQLSGFFVTAKDGSVLLAPVDGKGQGLVINGWEIASAAKMFGEGKTTTPGELNDALKTIPQFQTRDVGAMMFDEVRRNAENSQNPHLRMWARFIIELGKNSAGRSNAAEAAKSEEIELDAIQHLLMMRRLYGDLWARAERWKFQIRVGEIQNRNEAQFVKTSFSPSI